MFKKIRNNPFYIKYLKNSFWLMFEQVFKLSFSLLIYGYFSRYLGPEKLGEFNYARAIVSFFLPLATLGLSNIVIRELIIREEDSYKVLGSAFTLRIITAIISFILSLGVGIFLKVDQSTLIVIGIMAISHLFKVFDVIDLWYQAKVKSKSPAKIRSLAFFLSYGMYAIGVILKQPIAYFAVMFSLEFLISSTLLFQIFKKEFNIKKITFIITEAKNLLKNGWPLLLQGIAAVIYLRIDQIIIGKILGITEVGIYSSAVKLTEIWNFIPVAIISTIYPAIIEMRSRIDFYITRLQVLIDLMTWMGIIVAILTIIFSKHIIILISGSEFIEASTILNIYIWSSVMVSLGTVTAKDLIAANKTKIVLYRSLLAAGINIFLNFILIPQMGIIGAAIATVVSYSILALWGNIIFKDSRHLAKLVINSLNPIKSFQRLISYGKDILIKSQ